MKSIFTILILLIASDRLLAQDDLFDTPTITALIEHNKQNYSDHQDLRNKQIVSQASVSAWKDATNKMKSLVDGIDIRMNSFLLLLRMFLRLCTFIKALMPSYHINNKH